ncbi:MAG TPA: exodeoxyribonuclease VII large subunit, partial [Burkholderiaceae bacterium]
ADERLARLGARLRPPRLERHAAQVAALADRMLRAQRVFAASAGARVAALGQELDLVSPQAVLERGYAIVTRAGGEVVRAASEVGAAESLGVRLASGALDVKVTGRRG